MFKPSAYKSHPRYLSLYYRDLLSYGVERGITSLQGLTAHGRGEAFDYLLGEKTHQFAMKAVKCAAAYFLSAKFPVISVNGNTAVIAPKELIALSKLTGAKLEVNLFHKNKNREMKIASYLIKMGAGEVLLPGKFRLAKLESNRGRISERGQKIADLIFVPLEDGDRTEKLIKIGKKVITVDLNPLSRTAKKATVTIVDNIVRALPLLIRDIELLKKFDKKKIAVIINSFDNKKVLRQALTAINLNLTVQSRL